MVAPLRSLALSALASIALALPLRAGGVHIVGNPGVGVFPDIQQAVTAASAGDVLLVAPGDYAGFTIDGKGVSVFAAFPGSVDVTGTVTVRNLSPGRHAVLAGLAITGSQGLPQSGPALRLESNAGQIRLERCQLTGGTGIEEPQNCNPHGAGGHAVVATDCPRLSFAECTLKGGDGYRQDYGNYKCNGSFGGDGLNATATAAAIYHCTLTGGRGGIAPFHAGDGGDGCRISLGGIVAVGSRSRGGDGGFAWDWFGFGGDGGDGLYVDANAQAQLVDNRFFRGFGGDGSVENGAHGSPTAGPGAFRFHPGEERRFFVLQGVVDDVSGVELTAVGEHGDFVWLPMSLRPGWHLPRPTRGVWLVPLGTKMTVVPYGVLPSSGTLTRTLSLPEVLTDGMLLHTQGWARDVAHEGHIGSPVNLLVLNRDGQPDCDGDGMQDFVQILLGLAADLDRDLVPDVCQP